MIASDKIAGAGFIHVPVITRAGLAPALVFVVLLGYLILLPLEYTGSLCELLNALCQGLLDGGHGLKRLAALEASVEIVPVVDAVFAQTPAQVDFTPVAQAEKVDEAGVGVFEFAAEVPQFARQRLQGFDMLDQRFLQE